MRAGLTNDGNMTIGYVSDGIHNLLYNVRDYTHEKNDPLNAAKKE